MNNSMPNRCGGITRLEIVLVIAGLFLVVLCGVLPALSLHNSEKRRRVQCVANLKQMALGFRMWANDHAEQFCFHVSTNQGGSLEYGGGVNTFRHFQIVSNEIGSVTNLVCPQDSRQPARDWAALNNEHVSYFVNLGGNETQPTKMLCGDRTLAPLLFPMEMPPGYTTNNPLHYGVGNVALSDGSVMQASLTQFQKVELATGLGLATNRLAVPW